jgi:phage terminase Nu1 subunit (DNA packaging protein)
MEGFITEKELCNMFKVDRSTVWRWRREGLPYLGKKGSIRYDKSKVIEWLESRKNEQK